MTVKYNQARSTVKGMKIKTTRVPRSPLAKLKLIALKVNAQELEVITMKAKKYADGNLSAWVRHAALNFTPKK